MSIRILPGQYYDAETGTNYNYYRDYDPTVGRYTESDPIGLRGGLNAYVYVNSKPLVRTDRFGLVDWTGSFTGGSVADPVGAGVYVYDLTSECINGRRGKANGVAYGGAAGWGLLISLTTQKVKMSDFESTPNPWIFDGSFVMGAAGFALCSKNGGCGGISYTALLLLGAAHGEVGFASERGLDFGAVFVSGSSTVLRGTVERCGC
jgi:RHS repeat-associated protein